jgi:hypothetical protein
MRLVWHLRQIDHFTRDLGKRRNDVHGACSSLPIGLATLI